MSVKLRNFGGKKKIPQVARRGGGGAEKGGDPCGRPWGGIIGRADPVHKQSRHGGRPQGSPLPTTPPPPLRAIRPCFVNLSSPSPPPHVLAKALSSRLWVASLR